MRPQYVTVGSQTVSSPLPLDYKHAPFSVSLLADVSAGGNLTYKVQYTADDIFDSTWNPATANWQDHSVLTAQTASNNSNLAFPVTAVRLNVTAYTSGSVRLAVIQATASGG